MPLDKPADTDKPIHAIIRDRWSPRSFAAKPVPADVLATVLEAGRWAASASNGQPWRFIVATSADPAAHATAVEGFVEANRRWAKLAPVLMFVCARKTAERDGKPNAHAWYDTGAAAALMALQATAMGLKAHQAGGIHRDAIRATYAIPDEFDVCAGFALGYQDEPDLLPDDLAIREREARTRKPLSHTVFAGTFGRPFPLPG